MLELLALASRDAKLAMISLPQRYFRWRWCLLLLVETSSDLDLTMYSFINVHVIYQYWSRLDTGASISLRCSNLYEHCSDGGLLR